MKASKPRSDHLDIESSLNRKEDKESVTESPEDISSAIDIWKAELAKKLSQPAKLKTDFKKAVDQPAPNISENTELATLRARVKELEDQLVRNKKENETALRMAVETQKKLLDNTKSQHTTGLQSTSKQQLEEHTRCKGDRCSWKHQFDRLQGMYDLLLEANMQLMKQHEQLINEYKKGMSNDNSVKVFKKASDKGEHTPVGETKKQKRPKDQMRQERLQKLKSQTKLLARHSQTVDSIGWTAEPVVWAKKSRPVEEHKELQSKGTLTNSAIKTRLQESSSGRGASRGHTTVDEHGHSSVKKGAADPKQPKPRSCMLQGLPY